MPQVEQNRASGSGRGPQVAHIGGLSKERTGGVEAEAERRALTLAAIMDSTSSTSTVARA